MPYYVAIPEGDKFIIASNESFQIRSNALAYARRMGWEKICFIATSEQKAMIESGQSFGASVLGIGVTITPVPEEAIPDTTWMKEEGILWDKKGRKAKGK